MQKLALAAPLTIVALACGGVDESRLGDPAPAAGASGASAGAGGAAGEVASGGGSGRDPGSGGASAGSNGGSSGAAGGGQAGATGTPCALPPVQSGTSTRKLVSSGDDREYLLHVPAKYDATAAVPLVLVFHGYFGSASGMQGVTGLSALADQYGFAVAYGVGVSSSWNAGKCCGSSAFLQRPDVQYASDVIDHVAADVCVDPKRIYATGLSNGSMLSNRLGCALANRIAAFGAVAGPRAIDACSPSRPIPVIAFHGTADAVVPYDGGGSGGAESAAESFAFWSQNAGCTDAPEVVFANGDATCVERSTCAGGASVRLCTIQNGGHQWPGGPAIPGLGAQTKDIVASKELVEFFFSHALP